MSCRIDRDQDGKILKVYDPSGQESVLYKELLSVPGNTPESALEQYISTLEDPTIEFKKIPINMGLTSHMFVLGDEKIGTIRTKPYRDGVKVDQALVTESYRGQGIGTELYLETIRNLMAEGQKLYSDTSRTTPAERIWQKLVDLGLAFKNEDGIYETVLVDGVTPETTIDEVINRLNSAESNNIRFQIAGEQASSGVGQQVNVLITPATVRAFSEETSRLKALTEEYNKVASEIAKGDLANKDRFSQLQSEILEVYQQDIEQKVSQIRGVSVNFKSPYLGSWQGNYEPSLNMTLTIGQNADTGALSGLLFDIAENTSQDAFILEQSSEITDRTPLTEFDEEGFTHYPQIRVNFNQELTVEEKSEIAQKLNNSQITEFSIDGDYFIISLLDFESETEQQKIENYEKKRDTIAALFSREGGENRTNRFGTLSKSNRKSKYVGARNEGNEQSQTREYDRYNLFEKESVSNTNSQGTESEAVLQEVGNKMLENSVVDSFRLLSNEEIIAELVRRGISPEIARQVVAYHGSPHLFDRFSTAYMGTGEGAQAFGWGLYFTELEDIARKYANDLTSIAQERYGFFEFLDDNLDDFDYYANELAYLGVNERGEDAIVQLEEVLAQNREEIRDLNGSTDINDVEYVTHLQNQIVIAEKLIADAKQYLADLPSRNLYKVSLHKGKTPDQYTWLEWDKPYNQNKTFLIVQDEQNLSEESKFELSRIRLRESNEIGQKQALRQAIKDYRALLNIKDGEYYGYGNIMTPETRSRFDTTIEELQKILNYRGDFINIKNKTGSSIYQELTEKMGSPKAASLFLLENGIDGVKYPAESISRGATSDNARGFNYVVFDESAITIEEVIQFQKELSDNGLTLSTAGFFHNGEVFINKDVATTETVIHEFSHPYISKLKTDNPVLYNEGIEKLKTEGQAVIDWVKERQPDLTGDALLEEALVQAVGEAGNNLLNAERSKGLLDWIERFWNSLKDALGLSNYSIEEVRNMTLNEYAQALAIDSMRGSEVALEKGVASVRETVQKYKSDKEIKSVGHPVVKKLDTNFSREMATEYEKIPATSNSPEVVRAYEALERETLEQYDYIVSQGVTVERWQGKGEPYANSTEMLNDLRKNNHLYFLPNSEAFGSEGVDVEGRLGLKPTTRTLDDGYKMTLSEVFRVVHDYFGHGLLGNQFGAIGEENATLQHLDLYSPEALPAVIFQTRGQNSWVNFSGVNNEAKRLMSEANKENDPKKLEEAQKMFTFAEPKDNIFSNLYNFKKYDTVRRIREQREIEQQETYLDPRGKHENINTTEVLTRISKASSGRYGGLSRRSVQRTQSLGGHTVNVIGEYTFDENVSSKIKNAFPDFKGTQKIYEITDGDVYQKLLIEKSESNKFKACVTVHSAEAFSKMRLFVTEDGSTGVTLTKDGFLGGAFSDRSADRPNNLAQLMLVGIKEGAITAEAFDTVLPDYYSDFGFKVVSRTAFNEEYAPSIANGALADWDYETYKYFNNGRPDVVFMIYDGGDRSTIEDRLAQFDKYKTYQKHQVESYDKEGYDQAYSFMEISAINRGNYEMSKESSPYQFVTETFKQEPESVTFRVDGQETTSYREALQLGQGRDIEVGVVEDGQFQVLEVRTSSLNPTSPIGLVNSLVAESIVKETQAVEYGQPNLEVEGTDPVVRVVNEVIVKETALENGMKAKVAEDGTFEIESLEVQEDSVDKQVYDNVYDRLFGKPISEGMFIETDSQLSQKIFSFLEKLGFSVVSLENYKKRYAEKNGVEPNAEALIDLANQVIAFKEGRITEEALTEEFVHLILEGLPQDELTSLLDRIHETKEWADHSETYMKVYKNDEALVRKEILGKAIANRLQTREFNQGVFAEIWQKIKDFVNNILRPGLDSELDGLTDRVHDLLVRQDASSLEDLSKRKFRLYRIDNTMKDLVETAVRQIEEGEMQLKNSGSDKYLIAEAYQNLEQKHLELSVVNMLDLARRQVRYVKNALETSQINNTLLTGEERIVANNLKNVVQPIISKVRTEAESNPKLSKYLDYAKEVSDEISMLDTTVSEELADTIIDDIFKSNPNLQNEERDGMSFRDYYRKAFKVAESDTNFLFSIIGSIAHAKDALLEMLTHILKTMTTRAQFKFHDDALEFNRILREAGLKPKDLTQFYDKGGFMLSYWDWATHKKKLNEAKEETLKEIGFDYGDTFDPNKNYLEDMTPEQRSEYSEKLSKKRRNFENRKFNENFYKKMEDKMESLGLSQKTKDRINSFNLERAHIMRDVKRDSKQRPIFTRIDIEALEAYNIERRRAKSFYDSEGKLKSGIEVHSTEQPNSLLVGGLYYTLRPGADDSSTIAFEMTKYDQANIPATSHRGVSKFLDVLRGMEIGQAKAFVKANINMNPVYEEFEPEDVPPGKELAYEAYKKLSAQRRALLNRYRDPKNSTNILFHQMDKATQRKVRELTEDISVQRKLIDFQYDPEAEQTTEYGVNQAYNNWVREEGLAGNLELHIEKALEHVPMHQKAYLNSLFNSIELMQRGYAVSKLEQNRLTREFGEDFDISSLSLEDIQAEKLRAIEKRLAPYFMSHTPIGMNSSIVSLDNARNVDELIAKLEEMDSNPDLSLSMHYSYYEDNSADLNPDYNQNYKGGPIQPKDVNKEFESKLGLSAGSYTLDEYGVPVMKNGYPEPKLLPAYRALIMTNYKSLELQNEAGNVNLYQAPQVSKTSTDKIMSVLGGKSSLIETASEYIRELKEFRIDDLAIGEVDKNGEALAKQGIRVVPRRFVRPLENSSDVTDDLFFSMMLMLKESHLHKARKESLNQVLVLEQAANNRKYNNTNKQAQSTNTVKMMKSFIDNNIFGISEVANYKVNLPFVGTVDLAKVSKILHKYVRDRNLAYNLIVPMTSWVTAEVGLMIEGWVNQYIDADSVSSARKELARLTPNALTESLNVVKTSKLSMIAERFDLFNIQQSYENAKYGVGIRALGKLGYMAHTAGNYSPIMTAMLSSLIGHRLYNGQFLDYEDFKKQVRASRNLSSKEAKAEWNSLSDKTFYNYIQAGDGKYSLDYDKFERDTGLTREEATDILNRSEIDLAIKTQKISEIIDGNIRPEERSIAQRHFLLSFLTTHKGWMSIALARRFKNGHYSTSTNKWEEGHYMTAFRAARILLKDVVEAKGNPTKIKEQILKDWINANPVERTNMRRMLIEMGTLSALYMLYLMMVGFADDDENQDNSSIQFTAYIMERLVNETRSSQIGIGGEVLNTIQDPVVGFKELRKTFEISKLFDSDEVESGRYKGLSGTSSWLLNTIPGGKSMHTIYSGENIYYQRNAYRLYNSPDELQPLSLLIDSEDVKEMFGN